ncbi:MAG: hypothetical protein ACK5R4_05245, partial [Alphaproteobacteria bacterium]
MKIGVRPPVGGHLNDAASGFISSQPPPDGLSVLWRYFTWGKPMNNTTHSGISNKTYDQIRIGDSASLT